MLLQQWQAVTCPCAKHMQFFFLGGGGTLHRHVQAHKLSQTVKFEYKANNSAKQVFNTELEQYLLKYIKQAARMHY
jgi:hypothetical protein